MIEPFEDCPPEDLSSFEIKFQRYEDGTWSVYCPQWKCEMHTNNPTKEALLIVSDILTNNEGGPEPYNEFAKRAGIAQLKPHAQPKPPVSKFGKTPKEEAILEAHSKRSAAWNKLRQGR